MTAAARLPGHGRGLKPRRRVVVPCLISLVLGVALGGCGGGIPSSPPLLPATGIRGLVQEEIEGGAVPLTPRPPVIRPLSGVTVVVQTVHGQEVARKVSDGAGHFAAVLEPGTYLVSADRTSATGGLVPPPNQTVIVQARRLTAVTLTYQLLAP